MAELTPEQIEKIRLETLKKYAGKGLSQVQVAYDHFIQAGYDYAHKESLSFTNEKLVEIIAKRLLKQEDELQVVNPSTWEQLCWEDKEGFLRSAAEIFLDLSPYLSTIEQAKKEEREKIRQESKEHRKQLRIKNAEDKKKFRDKIMQLSRQALQEK